MSAALPFLEKAEPVKILLAPGVYREALGELKFRGQAMRTLLVIEGASHGKVIWSGADVFDGWKDEGGGVYSHAWTFNWGNWAYPWEAPEVLGQRAEMVFVDGKPLKQVLLETYDYSISGTLEDHDKRNQKWIYHGFLNPMEALKIDTFGVAERPENGKKIFVRLKGGISAASQKIEVCVRSTAMNLEGKSNVVLRNICFEQFASRTRGLGPEYNICFGEGSSNVLIDRCQFLWNNVAGLSLTQGDHFTIRDSVFNYNGFSGIVGGLTNSVLDGCETNYNNWRGDWGNTYGWWLAGVKLQRSTNILVRNHTAIGNLSGGFWFDVQCEHICLENCVFALNRGSGLSLELSAGPFYLDKILSANNGDSPFEMSIVGQFTLKNSILYNRKTESVKLNDRDISGPLVKMQWYLRTDPPALEKTFGPVNFHIENSVLLGGANQQTIFTHNNGLSRDNPFYKRWNYSGSGNIFFRLGDAPMRGYYVSEDWHVTPMGFDSAMQYAKEENSRWVDPAFVDPDSGDFSLKAASPLYARREALPARKIESGEQKKALEWFKWTGSKTEIGDAYPLPKITL